MNNNDLLLTVSDIRGLGKMLTDWRLIPMYGNDYDQDSDSRLSTM